MANYETLKSAIQQVVKTNGNNEITGALLQQSLLAMINSLGAYYQYAGIAQPNQNLGTPDQRVYYFTSGAGTYMGQTITDGQFGIIYYDSSWHNAILDIATANAVDKANGTLGLYETLAANDITWESGKYWVYNGDKGTQIAWQLSSPIAVTAGTIVRVGKYNDVSTVGFIVKVNSSNQFISLLKRGTTDLNDVWYVVEEDCYISVSCLIYKENEVIITRSKFWDSLNTQIQLSLSGINNDIDALKLSIDFSAAPVAAADIINGAYRVYDPPGNIVTASGYSYTLPLAVNKGDIIRTTRAINVYQAIAIATVVDSSGNPISLLKRATGESTEYKIEVTQSGYVSLSALTTLMDAFEIVKRPIQNRIEELAAEIGQFADLDKYVGTGRHNVISSEIVRGKYRTSHGTITTLNGYGYTNPIAVYPGDIVFALNSLIVPGVAFVTRVDSNGAFLEMLKAGESSVAQDYIYRVNFSGYISISMTTNKLLQSYVLSSNLIKTIAGDSIQIDRSNNLPAMGANPLSLIMRTAGLGGIIHKWGIIGDSLASGEMQCFTDESTSETDYKFVDMYQWSWGQRFAKLLGVDCYNFSNGGQTTIGWIQGGAALVHDETYPGGIGGGGWDYAKLPENVKQGYIIALAVNDRAREYPVGSVSTDIGIYNPQTDTDTNADSYVGYYAGIIQRIKSIAPKAKIFCVTPLDTRYNSYSQAIRDIVNHFDNTYLIDLAAYCPISWGGMYVMNGHGSAIGYEYTAYEINTYIDWIIRNNGNDFKATALIGTAYRENYNE